MVSVDGREHSARTAETSRRMSTVGAYGLRCRVDGSLRNYNERVSLAPQAQQGRRVYTRSR